MGKDLRGKELGVGITQRKDGLYQGRYKDRFGKSKTIYNSKLSELRKELSKAVTDNQQFTSVRDSITLDTWFDRWMNVYKKKRVRPNTIRQNEFFEACKGTFYDNMYNVAVNTGLRPGELFALTIADIHMDEGYIDVNKTLVYQKYLEDKGKTFHVEPPKTKQSYRHVPINSVCKEYLTKQFELKKIVSTRRPKEQNEYLFVTRFNTPINSVIYSDSIRSVVRRINDTKSSDNEFPFFSGHTFRHTFATRCFESGIEPKVVQSYLGHATLKMTMDLYTHVTPEKSFADIEKIVSTDNKIIEYRRKCV